MFFLRPYIRVICYVRCWSEFLFFFVPFFCFLSLSISFSNFHCDFDRWNNAEYNWEEKNNNILTNSVGLVICICRLFILFTVQLCSLNDFCFCFWLRWVNKAIPCLFFNHFYWNWFILSLSGWFRFKSVIIYVYILHASPCMTTASLPCANRLCFSEA